MLEKIYSVFVSSTYEDLREERAEVQRALLMAKCFPIGMELFPSTDEETWEFIKRQIEDADFYLLVIAGRYGSVDHQGISFTEKEYDYAREIKKPALAFVHSDPGSIAVGKTDQDDAKRQALTAFIKKIQSRPLVSRYTTPHELRAQVLLSITNLKETDKSAIGFIRSNQTADLKKYADALEEIARLKNEISSHNKAEPFPEAEQEFSISFIAYKDGVETKTDVQFTWGKIFTIIADKILEGSDTEENIKRSIIDLSPFPKATYYSDLSDDQIFNTIRSKMYARNLIEFQTETREGSRRTHTVQTWFLTDNGRVWYRKLQLDNAIADS